MTTTFEQTTLDNGLTLAAEINPDAHTAAVGFFVKTGTRDEAEPVMGVSHFLEHMMFKGTDRRTAEDVNREFDEIGANYNAYTSHECTVYYSHTLPEFLPRSVDLLGDMLRPALRDEDFDTEKNVILEEISMYDDRPHWRLQDRLLEEYFRGHPLGYRVLGTNESIAALMAKQMRDYFSTRYSPGNIVVAASGNLDFQQLTDMVHEAAGHWKPVDVGRDESQPPTATGEHTVDDTRVHRHYVASLSPGPSAQDDRRYAAKVLSDLVGDDDGSRLYWALIDPGLADEADFSYQPMDHCGAFMGYASCEPGKAEQVEQALYATIDGAARGLEEDELERVKNKLATNVTLQGERPSGRMQGVGQQMLYLGEYMPLSAELEAIQSVTRDDVVALLREFPTTERTVVRLTPG